jgi:CheY-like chemotaxis protein
MENEIYGTVSRRKVSHGTILLVEDEPFVREVTCEVLMSCGFKVFSTGGATEAIQSFLDHDRKVDLLLTDLVMPERSGRDLALELKAVCPGLKVLFTSGYPQVLDIAEECASTSFLAKPYSVRILVQKVEQMLGETDSPFSASAEAANLIALTQDASS